MFAAAAGTAAISKFKGERIKKEGIVKGELTKMRQGETVSIARGIFDEFY